MKTIDINAAYGFWPIQRSPYTSLAHLDAVLARNGVEEAWVSAVESILFPEPDTYDFALFEQLEAFPRLRGAKTVNPLLANWRAGCQKALERHSIKALKLFLNYHDCTLNHPEVAQVCDFAAQHDLPVLISLRLNDERNQPACLQVAPVDVHAISELALAMPQTTFIVLCALMHELAPLAELTNVMADIAFLDDEDPLVTAAALFPPSRLVYGSHAPFMYPESATFKIDYSQLPAEELQQIASGNIEEFMVKNALLVQ